MDIKKIMLAAYPEEKVAYSKALKALDAKIKKMEAARTAMAAECRHPSPYILIKNDGNYSPDGYGGEDYTGDNFRASCGLCGAHNVGHLRPNQGLSYRAQVEGTPVHVKAYQAAKDEKDKKDAAREEDYKKKLDLETLARLKAKYENEGESQ